MKPEPRPPIYTGFRTPPNYKMLWRYRQIRNAFTEDELAELIDEKTHDDKEVHCPGTPEG